MEDKENFEILVPPKNEHLSLVRQLIDTVIKQEYPIMKNRLPEIQLCASEAVANSISAHNNVKSQEPISVRVLLFKDYIEVQVQDKGRGFDLEKLPKPNPSNCTQETGWGLELMRSCSDFIEINPTSKGTFVRMEIYPQKGLS